MRPRKLIPARRLLQKSPLLAMFEAEVCRQRARRTKRLKELTTRNRGIPHTMSFIFSDNPSWSVLTKAEEDRLVQALNKLLSRKQETLDIDFEVVVNEDGFLEALVWGNEEDFEVLRSALKRFERRMFPRRTSNGAPGYGAPGSDYVDPGGLDFD